MCFGTSAASLAPAAAVVWVLARIYELLSAVPMVTAGGFDTTTYQEMFADAAGALAVPPVPDDVVSVGSTVGVSLRALMPF